MTITDASILDAADYTAIDDLLAGIDDLWVRQTNLEHADGAEADEIAYEMDEFESELDELAAPALREFMQRFAGARGFEFAVSPSGRWCELTAPDGSRFVTRWVAPEIRWVGTASDGRDVIQRGGVVVDTSFREGLATVSAVAPAAA